jgi:hypothetical protein
VTKTRNLKTDMTEFQWWWSIFLKYKSVLPRHFSYGLDSKGNRRSVRKARLISNSLSAIESRHLHLRLISNRESHDSERKLKHFPPQFDWRDDHHSQITTENFLFSDKTLINFSLFPVPFSESWNVAEEKRVEIKRLHRLLLRFSRLPFFNHKSFFSASNNSKWIRRSTFATLLSPEISIKDD